MIGFERKVGLNSHLLNASALAIKGNLSPKQLERIKRIKQAWNFYEGYHWEDIPPQDTPEITINYCRPFVDKFVAFELGKAFSISVSKEMSKPIITEDGRTLFEYLEDVWEDNEQFLFVTELGQSKSITGDAWVQVRYDESDELDDPYNEYEDGRIRLSIIPTSAVFPEYDPHQKGRLTKLVIMYEYERETLKGILSKTPSKETVLYKQEWTKDTCVIYDGDKEPETKTNKYKIIPFVQIKNLNVAGKNEGRGDLDDIIPLNTEYNMKESNISEIIDYHSAPITVVYGAKIGNLEKGANKMWGGLAKDARVENLELKSDLGASSNYTRNIKLSMCEVGGVPETVLGGAQAISNTSGVALQYINLPLIEKTRIKRMNTETGLEQVNKLIILVSLLEGLITKPDDVVNRDFYKTEVSIPDTLPKDMLLELQQIQQEMTMGMESRKNAMKRIGKENIDDLISEIDEDRKENPDIYGVKDTKERPQLNSGMTNGQTTVEQVRNEMNGQNSTPNETQNN